MFSVFTATGFALICEHVFTNNRRADQCSRNEQYIPGTQCTLRLYKYVLFYVMHFHSVIWFDSLRTRKMDTLFWCVEPIAKAIDFYPFFLPDSFNDRHKNHPFKVQLVHRHFCALQLNETDHQIDLVLHILQTKKNQHRVLSSTPTWPFPYNTGY